MNDDAVSRAQAHAHAPRLALRVVLSVHAGLWLIFALGMIALAVTSAESRANPVFVQVMIAACMAAVGSVSAARYRSWGVPLALLGGLGVIAAWIAGESGNGFRLPVAGVLGVFALAVVSERRAFLSSAAR